MVRGRRSSVSPNPPPWRRGEQSAPAYQPQPLTLVFHADRDRLRRSLWAFAPSAAGLLIAVGLAVLLCWQRRAELGVPELIAVAVVVGTAVAFAGIVWAVLLRAAVATYRQVAGLGRDAGVLTVDRDGIVLHQFEIGLSWPEIAEVRVLGRPLRRQERWAVGADVAVVLAFVPTEAAPTLLPPVRLPWSMRQALGGYRTPLVVQTSVLREPANRVVAGISRFAGDRMRHLPVGVYEPPDASEPGDDGDAADPRTGWWHLPQYRLAATVGALRARILRRPPDPGLAACSRLAAGEPVGIDEVLAAAASADTEWWWFLSGWAVLGVLAAITVRLTALVPMWLLLSVAAIPVGVSGAQLLVIQIRGRRAVAERRRGRRRPARGMPRTRDFWLAVAVGVLLGALIAINSS